MIPAERNYDTDDTELLAIVMSCNVVAALLGRGRTSNHYLDGPRQPAYRHDDEEVVSQTGEMVRNPIQI